MRIPETLYRSLIGNHLAVGGQELILNEVVALLLEHAPRGLREPRVYLPFSEACVTLSGVLRREGALLNQGKFGAAFSHAFDASAMYFGTPTIVNGLPLFGGGEYQGWDKNRERDWVRQACRAFESSPDSRRIVCGLGSGDITPEERASDMGGGRVVCFKDFGNFKDWVLVKDVFHAD